MIGGNDAGVAEQSGLVGRDVELEWIRSLVDDTSAGIGRTVVIDGEPGVGKTSLLVEIRAAARRRKIRVLSGGADEMEQLVPFAAIGHCVGRGEATGSAPTWGQIQRLMSGGTAGLEGAAREFAITEAILVMIDKWCAEGPVVLLVDDLQWADSGSVLTLYRLSQASRQLPLLLALARRALPCGEELDRLLRGLESRKVITRTLQPLSKDASVELAARLAGGQPDARLLELVTGADGNPFYMTELVAALNVADRIHIDAGVARVDSSGVDMPASLTAAIRRQLASLPAPTRELLSMAAVLGPRIDSSVLSMALDASFAALVRMIRDALRIGLLAESDGRISFRHDMVRRALEEEVPFSARTELHMRAARSLAQVGAPVERVAGHIVAGTRLDPVMADWLNRSAGQLVTRAPAVAVDVLTRVGVSTAGSADRDSTLQVQLARAQLGAGRPADAEAAGRAALVTVEDTDLRAQLHWIVAQACFRQGRYEATVAEVEHAVALPGISPSEAARFYVFVTQAHRYMGRLEQARDMIERAADLAYSDPLITAFRLTMMSSIEFTSQNLAVALELSGSAVAALGDREIPPDINMAPHLTHGFNLMESDRIDDADRSLESGMRLDERAGGAFTPFLHLARSLIRWWRGRWDDAIVEISATLDINDRLGLSQGVHGVGALIAVHRTSGLVLPELLRPDLAQEPTVTVGGTFFAFMRQWSLGLAADARGEQDGALDLLLEAWENCATMVQPARYWICPDLVRIADTMGDTALVKKLTAEMTELTARRQTPSVLATAQLCRGMLEHESDLVLGAAEAYRRAGRPLFQAHARESGAVLLARSGRYDDARTELGAALRIYAKLDAEHDTARALARLRHAGVIHAPYAPRRRGKTGWDAITETELRVAELVAEGLSNPEIGARMYISRRTVQCHVSNILTKLSFRSRVELALDVAKRKEPAG